MRNIDEYDEFERDPRRNPRNAPRSSSRSNPRGTASPRTGTRNSTRNAPRNSSRKRPPRKSRLSKNRLRIIMGVVALVVVFLLVILIDGAIHYNKIHSGITIAGQSVGGLTRDEADALLTRFVGEAEKRPITLAYEGKTWDVLPSDVGTEIDVDGAVTAAMDYTRGSNFLVDMGRRLKLISGEHDVPLDGTIDSAMMDGVLAMVAQELDDPPVNAGLAIVDGKIEVVDSEAGLVVDREALGLQLEALILSLQSSDLEVPMIVKEPDIVADDNAEAQALAEVMVGSSLALTYGDQSWSIGPQKLAAYIDFTAEDRSGVSTLVPYLSAEKMGSFFDEIAGSVGTKPVDATWDSDGKQAWVVPGVQGKALDPEKTAEAMTTAALSSAGRSAEVAVKTTDPDLTTEEAEAMGIVDKLGGYETTYGGTPARQQNVRMATKYVSDVLLAPGEEYNFLDEIGPRTPERGFLTAPGIVGPGKLEDVYGGGICQVSTTLFNAAFFAGLKITERRNHSIYIDHYPKGRDATVSEVSPNMRFVNDTDHHILVRGSSDGVVTIFSIYGTSDGRKVSYTTSDFYNIVTRSSVTIKDPTLGTGTTKINHGGQDGKQCLVTRTITWPDGRTKTDKFYSTWPALDQEIAVGTATTTTTLAPVTTTSTATTEILPPTTTTTEEPVP